MQRCRVKVQCRSGPPVCAAAAHAADSHYQQQFSNFKKVILGKLQYTAYNTRNYKISVLTSHMPVKIESHTIHNLKI